MDEKMKQQVVLHKDGNFFIFRYDAGSEDQLLDAIIAQAKNNESSFDWFDAAMVAHKLAQSFSKMDKDYREYGSSVQRKLVLCKCRRFVLYDSYDIVLGNSPLKQKVFKREINLFKCDKCGFKQELAEPFFYIDPPNDINVFVSPESTTIFGCEPGIFLDTYAHSLEFDGIQEIVFGFDELLEKLKPFED